MPPDIEEAQYLQMSNWSSTNWTVVFEARKFLESTWPDVYRSLKGLVDNAASRPDFILADYLVDAARDISAEYEIPLAMHWSQMPTAMLHAPYIPGTPGLQIDVLSSEYATLWQRLCSATAIYTAAPQYYQYLQWRKKMRAGSGVSRPLPTLYKPDYLCLVNSMFGLEIAKDIPPNVAAVGPILADTVDNLEEPYIAYLEGRSRVLYVSLGTHVLLPWATFETLFLGALAALDAGLIDGIIWPIRAMARGQLDLSALVPVRLPSSPGRKLVPFSELLAGAHPAVLFVEFAPQRSLLHDARIALFLSHCGTASVNEAVAAGVPIVALGVYFDQIQSQMRLDAAGVAIPLHKDRFTVDEVVDAIAAIFKDKIACGPIAANVVRIKRIADIARRRKYLAVDLVEEVLVDWEGRARERRALETCVGTGTGQRRYMHLQTADVRMPFWKARNWDLYGLCAAGLLCLAGIVVVLPLVLVYR